MAAARPRCLTFYMTYYTNGSNPLALAMKIIPTKLDVGEKVIYLKSLDNYTQKTRERGVMPCFKNWSILFIKTRRTFLFQLQDVYARPSRKGIRNQQTHK